MSLCTIKKNTLCHADSNAFIKYVEYYFHYVCSCMNDILWYASFYNPSFSLAVFSISIRVDIQSLVSSIKVFYCILGSQHDTFYWSFSWRLFRLFLFFSCFEQRFSELPIHADRLLLKPFGRQKWWTLAFESSIPPQYKVLPPVLCCAVLGHSVMYNCLRPHGL